jgi:Trypsin-like peptidase domain
MADRLEDLLRGCTVRVTSGPRSGAGFFVAPGKVLTCVHVIRDCAALAVPRERLAVRWERDGQPALETERCRPVAVLADKGRPIPALECPYPDIAVLEVDGLDGHPCVGIDLEWPSQEDGFQVFGYPEEGHAVQLTPARLTYRGIHGTLPTAYLDLASDTIKRGMSGAAVLNRRSGAVCGVVVASKHIGHPDGALAIPWSAIVTDLADVLAANRAFHAIDKRWEAAARAAHPCPDEMAPVLTATAEWVTSTPLAPLMHAPYWLEATVRNGSNRDYKVRGKRRPADHSEPCQEISSFTLPALGTSEKIPLGSHKKPRRGPETFKVYDARFLMLETTGGTGNWKRAFEVPRTLLNRWGYPMREPMPMMAIPYDSGCR